MRKELIVGISLLTNILCFSQSVIKHGNQEWFTYANEFKFSNKISVNSDIGYRVKNNFENRSVFLIRSTIAFTPSKHIQLGGGLSYFQTYTGKSASRYEYRIQQEFNHLATIKKIKLRQRFRLEERIFDYPNNATVDFQFRYRFMSQALIPIAKFGDKQLSFSIADEFMLKSKILASDKRMDQNRILFGPVFKFSPSLEAKIIYISQLLPYKKTDDFEYNNIYWLTITQKLSTKKYKEKIQTKS